MILIHFWWVFEANIVTDAQKWDWSFEIITNVNFVFHVISDISKNIVSVYILYRMLQTILTYFKLITSNECILNIYCLYVFFKYLGYLNFRMGYLKSLWTKLYWKYWIWFLMWRLPRIPRMKNKLLWKYQFYMWFEK